VFHGSPHVSHTVEPRDRALLKPWMSITVEPMLTSGSPTFHQGHDGWTEFADDGLPSAQFEHTVVVTEHGVEILTVTADGHSLVGSLPAT
jgi:methionyl aminopeptidase